MNAEVEGKAERAEKRPYAWDFVTPAELKAPSDEKLRLAVSDDFVVGHGVRSRWSDTTGA